MKYPDRGTLIAIGAWAQAHGALTEEMADDVLWNMAG
jgi:hypothetical protein